MVSELRPRGFESFVIDSMFKNIFHLETVAIRQAHPSNTEIYHKTVDIMKVISSIDKPDGDSIARSSGRISHVQREIRPNDVSCIHINRHTRLWHAG